MVAEVRIDINQGVLDRLLNSPDGQVSRSIEKLAEEVQQEAKDRCPVGETGNLRDSITVRSRATATGTVFFVGSDLPYARFIVNGTPEDNPGDWIYPTTKQVMKFEVKGQTVYARRVRGIQPNNFLGEALSAVISRL